MEGPLLSFDRLKKPCTNSALFNSILNWPIRQRQIKTFLKSCEEELKKVDFEGSSSCSCSASTIRVHEDVLDCVFQIMFLLSWMSSSTVMHLHPCKAALFKKMRKSGHRRGFWTLILGCSFSSIFACTFLHDRIPWYTLVIMLPLDQFYKHALRLWCH